mgnify:CR=1 FL=1
MVTTFNRRDLISFGSYMVSDERLSNYSKYEDDEKENRLAQVNQIDFQNWLSLEKKNFIESDGFKDEIIASLKMRVLELERRCSPDIEIRCQAAIERLPSIEI